MAFYKSFADSNPIKDLSDYSYMDEQGVYFSGDLSGPNFGQYRYDVVHPLTKKVVKEPYRGWVCPESTMLEWINQGLVRFGKDETTVPRNKVYLKDNEYQSLTSVIYKSGIGATKNLVNLMGGDYFSNPKSVEVLQRLIRAVGVDDGDFVLDFFSGSGSTAHAVMALNSEDNGARRSISVQLPEPLDPNSKAKTAKHAISAGFTTIDEIGRKRISLAADKIKAETDADIDYGFRLFRVEEPTTQALDTIEDFDPNQFTLFSADRVDDFTPASQTATGREVILTTWLNKDHQGLTPEVAPIMLESYELPVSGRYAYVIDAGFTNDDLVKLVELLENGELQIRYLVCLPYSLSFAIANELESAFASMKNNQTVSLELRY